jgi:hypothetical protein
MAEPGEFLRPVSAMLTRALAEAAAGSPAPLGNADGAIYLVASYTAVPAGADSNPPGEGFPTADNGLFDIQPAYASYQDARDRARELGDGYGVFGPFHSTFAVATPGQPTVKHLVLTTSADAIVRIPSPGFRPPSGTPSAAAEFDALFFTADAVAKFALPYYSEIYGNGFGRAVLTQFQSAPLALMGHMPWSEYTEITADGTAGAGRSARGIPVVLHADGRGGYERRPIHPETAAPAAVS